MFVEYLAKCKQKLSTSNISTYIQENMTHFLETNPAVRQLISLESLMLTSMLLPEVLTKHLEYNFRKECPHTVPRCTRSYILNQMRCPVHTFILYTNHIYGLLKQSLVYQLKLKEHASRTINKAHSSRRNRQDLRIWRCFFSTCQQGIGFFLAENWDIDFVWRQNL